MVGLSNAGIWVSQCQWPFSHSKHVGSPRICMVQISPPILPEDRNTEKKTEGTLNTEEKTEGTLNTEEIHKNAICLKYFNSLISWKRFIKNTWNDKIFFIFFRSHFKPRRIDSKQAATDISWRDSISFNGFSRNLSENRKKIVGRPLPGLLSPPSSMGEPRSEPGSQPRSEIRQDKMADVIRAGGKYKRKIDIFSISPPCQHDPGPCSIA